MSETSPTSTGSSSAAGDHSAISVVIPTHNRSHLLVRAIESSLSQGIACGEVIVVDDHSTDDTAEVVKSFADPRIVYLRSESRGAPAARNLGTRTARFELIKFLDDDDYLLPDALAGQLRNFHALDTASRDQIVIYGNAIILRPRGSSRAEAKRPLPRRRWESDVEYLLRVNVLTSCPLHQRRILDAVGGFDESLKWGQEKNLHLRLAVHGARFVHRRGTIYVQDTSGQWERISTRKTDRDGAAGMFAAIQWTEELIRSAPSSVLTAKVRRVLIGRYTRCMWLADEYGQHDLGRQCQERIRALSPWPDWLRRLVASDTVMRAKRRLDRMLLRRRFG